MIEMKALTMNDADMVLAWRNSEDVSRFMYTSHTISRDEHVAWVRRVTESANERYWVITVDQAPVGLAGVMGISREHSRCSWAFYIASPLARGRGVGSHVEKFIIAHVFEELGLQKLCCEVLDFNEPVLRLHRKFGFKEEGRLRRHVFKDGHWRDVVVLGLLLQEWRGDVSQETA